MTEPAPLITQQSVVHGLIEKVLEVDPAIFDQLMHFANSTDSLPWPFHGLEAYRPELLKAIQLFQLVKAALEALERFKLP